MSLKKNNVVSVHVYAHTIYPEKPVEVPGCEYKHNVISFEPSIRIDIPGVEFGYNIETREFIYKKDGGEWTPMAKEDDKNGK